MIAIVGRGSDWQTKASFGFGVVFVAALLTISFFDRTPSQTSWFIYRTVLATSVAGLTAVVPLGWLKLPKYLQVGAGLVLWVLVFYTDIRPIIGRRICPPAKLGTYAFSDLKACFERQGTILVEDDFERPRASRFKPEDYPLNKLYFEGGKLVYDRRADDGRLAGWPVPGTAGLKDFILHVLVSYEGGYIQGDPSVAVYLLRRNNPDDTMKRGYILTAHIPYEGRMDSSFVRSHRRGKVSLYEKVEGEQHFREPPQTSGTVKATKWGEIAIFVRCKRGRLQIYINEEQAFDVDVREGSSGEIWLGAGGRATVTFDHLIVAALPTN